MNIIPHPYPEVAAAHKAGNPIRYKWPSTDWIDFDPDSPEPPSFDCPILQWQVKPTAVHPLFAGITDQFNSIFGGV